MIDIEIGILQPALRLALPASEDSLPIARQALRSVGETVDAELEALEDAELALTEACANAVEHAYSGADGSLVISLTPGEDGIAISVRDFGRGIADTAASSSEGRGFGLAMIEGIARKVDIRGGDGTEITMEFEVGPAQIQTVDGAVPGAQPVERILRRLVAVVAAQADMPVDRVMEALLVAELAATNALRRLVGDRVRMRIERDEGGFDLRLGPLEESGARATVEDSDVPVVGAVVERLTDGLRVERETLDGVDVEFLVLRIEPASA